MSTTATITKVTHEFQLNNGPSRRPHTIRLKHSAPQPKDVVVPTERIRHDRITFVATIKRGPEDREPSLRITIIPCRNDQSFGAIFADYREKAGRGGDILSFWRHEATTARRQRVWPAQTPHELFEVGRGSRDASGPPGLREKESWCLEVREWEPAGFRLDDDRH